MNKTQKLAALLVILGAESAAQLLKGLDDSEIEAVTAEMGKVEMLGQQVQAEILKEFTEVALEAGTSIHGGLEFAQSTLEKALGQLKAATILSRIAPGRGPSAAAQRIASLEPRQIFNLLKYERPQAIALILSNLAAEKGSQVLSMLPPDVRGETVERLANLAPTSADVVESVVEVLLQGVDGKQAGALRKTGGVKSAADLLNALDRTTSESLLRAIEERRPELVQAIRRKMFTFDDLASLEPSDLRKILREIDSRDLAAGLKNASDTLKSVLLGCISKRAAETVNEEISFLGSLKMRDIEAARDRIIAVVRRLETEGEIDLGQGAESEDEVLA